jgi:hypothetical protein
VLQLALPSLLFQQCRIPILRFPLLDSDQEMLLAEGVLPLIPCPHFQVAEYYQLFLR